MGHFGSVRWVGFSEEMQREGAQITKDREDPVKSSLVLASLWDVPQTAYLWREKMCMLFIPKIKTLITIKRKTKVKLINYVLLYRHKLHLHVILQYKRNWNRCVYLYKTGDSYNRLKNTNGSKQVNDRSVLKRIN